MPDRQDTPSKLTDDVKLTSSSRDSSEFPADTLLSGRYRIISKCGQGGMGVVYKVEQIFVHKQLALKTINRKDIGDTALRRFQHEARAAFAVDHPNVIAVHDFGLLDDGTPFFAMDFIDGMTLAQMISARGHLPIEEAVAIFMPVCFGLAAAHRQGIVHRDLKPSNIMLVAGAELGAEGSVKVVDFGIAKLTQHEGGEIPALTRTGEIFGSPMYMSPEQCRGGNVDHRSDVYSLGCVLFEALTGTAPFMGENALSTLMQHQSEPAPTLKEASLGKEFPKELEKIVAKMLAKTQDDRYQNFGAVAHALSRVCSSDPSGSTAAATERERLIQSTEHADAPSLPLNLLVTIWLLTAIAFGVLGFISHHFITLYEVAKANKNAAATARHPNDAKPPPSVVGDFAEAVSKKDPVGTKKAIEQAISHPKGDGRISFTSKYIDGQGLKAIADTPWVTIIEFNFCEFDNDRLFVFENKPNLTAVLVPRTNFDDVGCGHISRCANLVTIEADGSMITDAGLLKIAKLKKLTRLEISSTNTTQVGFAAIAKMNSLTSLRMRDMSNLTNETLSVFARSHLQNLEVDHNKQLDDGAIHHLYAMPELTYVSLSGTNISANGLVGLLEKGKIVHINVSGCPKLSADDIKQLKRRFPKVDIDAHDPEEDGKV